MNMVVKVGDLIPRDGISREEKHELEINGIKSIMNNHPGINMIIELWREFEEAKTDEAIFVLLLDKFQSVLQAKEYSEKYNRPEIFDEFYVWYHDILKTHDQESLPPAAKILRL